MAPTPMPRNATSRPGRAAGVGAVALAMLVAIVVAALFLVLIGADRSDQAARLITTAPPPAATTPMQPGIPCPPHAGTALATHDALSDLAPRPTGVRPDNNNRTERENKQ
jgi:hypothetical protein